MAFNSRFQGSNPQPDLFPVYPSAKTMTGTEMNDIQDKLSATQYFFKHNCIDYIDARKDEILDIRSDFEGYADDRRRALQRILDESETGWLKRDIDFLSLVQKHYANVNIQYVYSDGDLTSANITGDITATITWSYNGGNLTQEKIVVIAPFEQMITTTYGYSGSDLTSEGRVVG